MDFVVSEIQCGDLFFVCCDERAYKFALSKLCVPEMGGKWITDAFRIPWQNASIICQEIEAHGYTWEFEDAKKSGG